MENRISKVFKLVLSFFMLVTMMPMTTRTAHAETKELTIYFDARNHQDEILGLWFWGDATAEEDQPKEWMVDDYRFEEIENHYFVKTTVPILEGKGHDLEYLIVSHNGEKEKIFEDDASIHLPSEDIREVWIDKENNVHYLEPSAEEDILRIYLQLDNRSASDITAWVWGEDFDESMIGDSFDHDRLKPTGEKDGFVYFDLKLKENFDPQADFGFLFHDGQNQSEDFNYHIEDYGNTIYVQWNEKSLIRDNPFFLGSRLLNAQWIDQETIEVHFDKLPNDYAEELVLMAGSEKVAYTPEINDQSLFLKVSENDFQLNGQWEVQYQDQSLVVPLSWKLKDLLYQTDIDLGLTWQGNTAKLNFWSPSADKVSIVVFDAKNQNKQVFEEAMTYEAEDNVWTWKSEGDDLKNAYYQLKIERDGQTIYALDPYAKSMAVWDGLDLDRDCASTRSECVAKAAFVDPSDAKVDLDYAQIEGYRGREDAIIYETHVRDFTSDQNIETELSNPFGSFSSFIEKLDYLEDLGVTHIQLLPIMSYYFINESQRDQRVLDPTAQGKDSNYNWGYDPHSYFSISGFYSSDPSDPSLRILEFKQLIDAIHQRGMGVILDVVYNHTAQVPIFEDLEPEYYHFMDHNNNPKTSFGGGRLGTTHAMSRKLLIDSIVYWTEEFKVDGFRFDMMGDHDAETIQLAYNEASKRNPKTLFLGEGWRTYVGDDNDPRQAADQDWMKDTSDVGVFSDEYRNMMKSGFPNEGSPQFLTGGAQNIQQLFKNIQAQPGNVPNDEPQDIVQYLEAHDNLTLHDVIAISIKKSPQEHQKEILQRQRLGNLMLLTSQGTIFMHSGQEYGRTRQVMAEDDKASKMDKIHALRDESGQLIKNPYFVSDAYNSSDAINHFDWAKVSNKKQYPEHVQTYEYTKGLIALRKEFDAFRLQSLEEINERMELIKAQEMNDHDLVLAYRISGEEDFYVIVNADSQKRKLSFDSKVHAALRKGKVLADREQVNIEGIEDVQGMEIKSTHLELEPLSAVIVKVDEKDDELDFHFNYKDRLNNAMILHTWNWSFKEIEKEIENIAKAGYQAIQTSPLQVIKEKPKDGSEWWLLYQPLDFAFGDHLGTREEFKAMIEKAHEHNIDVIVDVVFNHLANDAGGEKACIPSKNIAERFKDKDMWHDYECVQNWNDRSEVTQKGIGLPDLNTDHPKVQEYAIDYLNDLLSLGVDGFRFDAAKHIELPHDTAVQGQFWPNVLGALERDDIYIYGEILQDQADDFLGYKDLMDVTASNYGYALLDVLKGSPSKILLDYRAHEIDPSHLLTWVESHDTYANENAPSFHLSDQDIQLAWSVLAGRKDHTALFFNRPDRTVKDKFAKEIGQKGDDLWKDSTIIALNQFHQKMGDTSEYLRFPNDESVMIERGQKGLLLTNFSSESLQLKDYQTSFADGYYVNTLNPDETFTIKQGKISGTLEGKGIAILYQDSELPSIQSNYQDSKFKGVLDLEIQVEQAEEAFYRLNNGEWQSFENKFKLSLGEQDFYLQEYSLDVKAKNKHGEVERTFKYQKDLEETISVYFKKPQAWGEEVNLYVYNAPGEALGPWPGSPMEKITEDWYRYSFDETMTSMRVLVNAENQQYPAPGAEGIHVVETIWIDENFITHSKHPELDTKRLEDLLKGMRDKIYAERYGDLVDRHNEILLKARAIFTQEELDRYTEEIEKEFSEKILRESDKKFMVLLDKLQTQKEEWLRKYEQVETEEEMQKLIVELEEYLAKLEESHEDSDKEDEKPTDNGETEDEKPTDNGETEDEKPTDNSETEDEKPTDNGETEDEKPTDNGETEDEKPTDNGESQGEKPTNNGGIQAGKPIDKGGSEDEKPSDHYEVKEESNDTKGDKDSELAKNEAKDLSKDDQLNDSQLPFTGMNASYLSILIPLAGLWIFIKSKED